MPYEFRYRKRLPTSDQAMILANQFMRKADRDNYNLRNLYRDVSGKNLGVNKASPEFNVDVVGNVNSTTDYFLRGYLLVPTGTIMPYAGPISNLGHWLFCDGDSVSRSTYQALFQVIGTTYGVGDSSDNTTFNVPDFKGRMPLGAGNGSGLTSRTLGNAGGQEVITEVPKHSHTGTTDSSGSHTHSSNATGDFGITQQLSNGGHDSVTGVNFDGEGTEGGELDLKNNHDLTINSSGEHTHTFTTNNTGSETVNIMNPYLVVNFIIKY